MTGRIRWLLRGSTVWLFMSAAALMAATPALAQDAGAPSVESILKRTSEFYKKARTFEVTVERAQTFGDISAKTALDAVVARPNRLALRARGDAAGIEIVSDGKSMFILIGPVKKYTETKAPASLDDLTNDPIIMGFLQGSMLGELCSDDPYGKLMDGVTSTKYVGLETVDGAKAHHLKFIQDQFDWDAWIAAEGDPLVRRIVMDLAKTVANGPAAAQFKGKKVETAQNFKGWKIDKELAKSAFSFTPPKDAQKAASLMEALGQGQAEEETSPLLGKPAPAINLKKLGEGQFKLADERDKHPVMIDFWATWCGPCVMELPILADVSAKYKEKGIVFVAVNQREKPEEIKTFLKAKKLNFTVALDSEGEAGNAYGVEGIPTLVLIDKNGVVQAVHIGYSPSIKDTLPKELDDLLAGKELIKKKPAKDKTEKKGEKASSGSTVNP